MIPNNGVHSNYNKVTELIKTHSSWSHKDPLQEAMIGIDMTIDIQTQARLGKRMGAATHPHPQLPPSLQIFP
jgi:hypothetical protein